MGYAIAAAIVNLEGLMVRRRETTAVCGDSESDVCASRLRPASATVFELQKRTHVCCRGLVCLGVNEQRRLQMVLFF